MAIRPQRYYYSPTASRTATTRHSLLEPRDLYPPPHRSEAQQPSMDSYASDASASFAPSFPPVRSGCFEQPPRATPAASTSRGSCASGHRGDAPSPAHRRALSVSECEKLLLPSPPRGDRPAACAFRRRRQQLALSKKPSFEANAAAAMTESRASTESFSLLPASSSPMRMQRADGADDTTPSPRVFARSKAYSTPATIVARHSLAPQGKPDSHVVASQAAAQAASNANAQVESNAAAEAAPSVAAQAASHVVSRCARSFFLRVAHTHGHQAVSSSNSSSSSSTPVSPTSSATAPSVRTYSSCSAPCSPRSPLPCTMPGNTCAPPITSSAATLRRAEAEAGGYQPVRVKPCLTAPSSTCKWSTEVVSPSNRSHKRVSFVKYVEILEFVT